MFLLESPHRGDSNVYKKHTIINIKRKSAEIIPNTMQPASFGIIDQELKSEFEIAVVNEPSVM